MGGRWSATEVCRGEKITYGDQCLPSTVGPGYRTQVLMAGSVPLLVYIFLCVYVWHGCVRAHVCTVSVDVDELGLTPVQSPEQAIGCPFL